MVSIPVNNRGDNTVFRSGVVTDDKVCPMATSAPRQTATEEDPFTSRFSWQSGALAGFVATVVTGLMTTLTDFGVVWRSVAGLYGLEEFLVAGWVAHLIHGTLFGVGFAAILSDPGLYRLSDWAWKTVLAGVVYGLVLAVGGAGFIMPVWLALVGSTAVPPAPNVTASLLAWHLVYGVVLGGSFVFFDQRL